MRYVVVDYDRVRYKTVTILDIKDGAVETISTQDTINILKKNIEITGVILVSGTLVFKPNAFAPRNSIQEFIEEQRKSRLAVYKTPTHVLLQGKTVISKDDNIKNFSVKYFDNFNELKSKVKDISKSTIFNKNYYFYEVVPRHYSDEKYNSKKHYYRLDTISNISLKDLKKYIDKYYLNNTLMKGYFTLPKYITGRSTGLEKTNCRVAKQYIEAMPIIVNMYLSYSNTSFVYSNDDLTSHRDKRKLVIYKYVYDTLEAAGVTNIERLLFIENMDYIPFKRVNQEIPLDISLLVFNIIQTGSQRFACVLSMLKLSSLNLSYLQMVAYLELSKAFNFSFREILDGWMKKDNKWIVKPNYDIIFKDERFSLRDELIACNSNLIKPVDIGLKSNFNSAVSGKKLKVPEIKESDKKLLKNIIKNEDKNIEKAIKSKEKKKKRKV